MTDDEIAAVARAIYMTHWKQSTVGGYPPVWDNVSEAVRAFVRAQAVSAIKALEGQRTPGLLRRPQREEP